MAVLAIYLGLFKDWKRFLSAGERAVILLVAADREQARILHRYCAGLLKPKILAREVEGITANEISFKNSVTIEICACSFKNVRGRSVCCALLDEVSFWPREDSASPDADVFNAIRASMATFGDEALVVASSSPYSRSGILWEAFRKWQGTDGPHNLVWRADTRTMNPSVPQSFVDREYERDPNSADAEYGANFRSDIAEFVSLAVLEACTLQGVHEIAPLPAHTYCAFVDPSGGSSDSMTLGISHREPGGELVLDCIREVQPPFAPENAAGARRSPCR